jgi:predicted nucleotidyltransferase
MGYTSYGIEVIAMKLTQSVMDHDLFADSMGEDTQCPEMRNILTISANTGSQASDANERKTDFNYISETLDIIKTSILKYVEARNIYLFGSYAYGSPTNKSDIDIYTVVPDNTNDIASLYVKIMTELNEKDLYFIDLLFGKESVFSRRKDEYILEKTIYAKGKLLYES